MTPRGLDRMVRGFIMQLYLLRHGEVVEIDRHYGQTDMPLSPRGCTQAIGAAQMLARVPLAAVYSSDLSRAVFGAEQVAMHHHGLTPILDPALREMHLGVLDGLSRAEARERYPELQAKRYADLIDQGFPGGESLRQVAVRVSVAFDRLLTIHANHTIALVGHNSVNRLILARALGLPLEGMFGFGQSYGCINQISYEGGQSYVNTLNWTQDATESTPPSGSTPPSVP